jgi:hypothetical protein
MPPNQGHCSLRRTLWPDGDQGIHREVGASVSAARINRQGARRQLNLRHLQGRRKSAIAQHQIQQGIFNFLFGLMAVLQTPGVGFPGFYVLCRTHQFMAVVIHYQKSTQHILSTFFNHSYFYCFYSPCPLFFKNWLPSTDLLSGKFK